MNAVGETALMMAALRDHMGHPDGDVRGPAVILGFGSIPYPAVLLTGGPLRRAIQRERSPRREDDFENGPIPNPLQQTYDKRFVQKSGTQQGKPGGRGGRPALRGRRGGAQGAARIDAAPSRCDGVLPRGGWWLGGRRGAPLPWTGSGAGPRRAGRLDQRTVRAIL